MQLLPFTFRTVRLSGCSIGNYSKKCSFFETFGRFEKFARFEICPFAILPKKYATLSVEKHGTFCQMIAKGQPA